MIVCKQVEDEENRPCGNTDPLATGLMIMLIGKATKVSQFLISLDKACRGTFELGVETDSQDSDGEIVERKDYLMIFAKI